MRREQRTVATVLINQGLAFSGQGSPVTEETKHKFTNRLIHEASPYLLQHAHNPVDWLPWGDAAFDEANREGKPMFLSIGYSTCHWCHVMAHESFENEQIAAILNEKFISIKVDREELPGVDAVYMEFVQKTTGSGGWPMSVFLTTDGKPFFGGTYFPPVDRYGRPGFETLLLSIHDAWSNRRKTLVASAEEITVRLQEKARTSGQLQLDVDVLQNAYHALKSIYDPQLGGFGNAPKFPQPSMLFFLMVYAHRSGNEESLAMVEKTLDQMADGGIYDHLGGGFHRYSVDPKWLVPHFEKMLYDQALITRAMIQAYQLNLKKERCQEIVEEVFAYVLRDMISPEGAFYSAEDADSEGREGVFYVWTLKEIETLLSRKEEMLVKLYYGVSESGNFEHGSNILHRAMPLTEAARQACVDFTDAKQILNDARQKLFAAREKRIRPHRDEKVIAGWNGMMISSLANGGAVLGKPEYIQAARRSAEFVLDHLYTDERLKRYYANGQSHGYAVLDDYAHWVRALIDLYQADFDPKWLKTAIELSDEMITLFEDSQAGGFYLTGSDAELFFIRTRPDYDGAVPNGNSIAAENLLRLAELTGDQKWLQPVEKVLAFYQEDLKKRPASLTQMLTVVDQWIGPRSEIVVSVPPGKTADETLKVIRSHFLPRTVVLLRRSQADDSLLEEVADSVKGHVPVDDKVTIYLCENFICKQPMVEFDVFQKAMEELK